jgi:predicted ATP-dependent endonuclease of OLD family
MAKVSKPKKERQLLQKAILGGYRSIQKVDIDFNPGLNIIIGKNGSGKTNFFNFLDSALNLRFDDFFDFNSTIIMKDSDVVEIHAQRKRAGKEDLLNGDNKIISAREIEYGLKLNGKKIKLSPDPEFDIFINHNLKFQSNIIKHGLPRTLPILETPYSFTINAGSGCSISFSYITDSANSYFIRSILTDFIALFSGSLSSEKNWPDLKRKKALIKAVIDSHLNEVKSDLNKYTPVNDIRLNESFNIYFDADKKEVIINNLVLDFRINNSWLPFSSLSDGTRRIVHIVTDLALEDRFIFWGNNVGVSKTTSRITLIEEPELGIHPHQLHLLMTFLKEQSRNRQIIITTHSPQVLDLLDSNELDRIILCEFHKETGTQLRHLTKEEQEKAKSYLEDEMYLSDYWRFSDFNRE